MWDRNRVQPFRIRSLAAGGGCPKAIEDSGFDIPSEVYVREALYGDVPAIQFEGNPQFLTEDAKSAIRSELGDEACIVFFTDPSAVVDNDGNLLSDRLIVLIGPIENEESGQVVRVGVLEGSGLENTTSAGTPWTPRQDRSANRHASSWRPDKPSKCRCRTGGTAGNPTPDSSGPNTTRSPTRTGLYLPRSSR